MVRVHEVFEVECPLTVLWQAGTVENLVGEVARQRRGPDP